VKKVVSRIARLGKGRGIQHETRTDGGKVCPHELLRQKKGGSLLLLLLRLLLLRLRRTILRMRFRSRE
jgi:hypothetical protein